MQQQQQQEQQQNVAIEQFAVPTLKVMRLQKPNLDISSAGTLDASHCFLGNALCLPNSFGVIHVGETFTAYLGALNCHKSLPVSQLTITAQLQTPTQRWQLATRLDEQQQEVSATEGGGTVAGLTIQPNGGVDCLVAHSLEEAGQHILRVEVGYASSQQPQAPKSLRKFYRFQVSPALQVQSKVVRISDRCCFASITVSDAAQGMTITGIELEAAAGLKAKEIKATTTTTTINNTSSDTNHKKDGVVLYDNCGRLEPGAVRNYLFEITTVESSPEGSPTTTSSTKGIAAGDSLGQAVIIWRKACGETGRLANNTVQCPTLPQVVDESNPQATMLGEASEVMVPMSCLSMDVASMAASRAANPSAFGGRNNPNKLDLLLPITVEPIDPPKTVPLGLPFAVTFLLVNHSNNYLTLQLQFLSEFMKGLTVCGPSFVNLEEMSGNGGSAKVEMRFFAVTAGLLHLKGCNVVDLSTGHSIPQPPLFSTFVAGDE